MPIVVFLILAQPYDIILSLAIVATIVGVFLVRYRARKTKVHWKVTLFETVAIVIIAVVVSLTVGSIA
jgi:hypothetical protein